MPLSSSRIRSLRRSLGRRALAPLVVVAALAIAPTATAAPTLADKATAQALFEDALQLMGAKKYADACPKLEESERLDPALGTRFRLSECEEFVGRYASAWAGFLEVADLAHASGQNDRETLARTRAAAIEPKLSRVKVSVTTPDTPGLEVAHDHTIVGRGQWGTPVPIDPGTYTVTATAPGKKPWRGSVTVAADGTTSSLTVPGLDDATAVVALVPVGTAAAPAPVVPPENHPMSGAKMAGFGLIGVGAAGIITSGIMGLLAKVDYNGAGNNCGPTSCNASGKSTIDSARSLADVATVVFAASAAVGVGGLVLVLTTKSGSEKAPASTALRIGPGSCFFEGSF
jgi:hypothetical protein